MNKLKIAVLKVLCKPIDFFNMLLCTQFARLLLNILSISMPYSFVEGVTWGPLVDLASSKLSISTPSIVSDPNGNAMAVWESDNGSGYNVIAALYYTTQQGWAPIPTTISLAGGNSYIPQVAMDVSGNAMAIWQRSNGIFFDVQAAYYSVSTNAWSPSINISVEGQGGITPSFCFMDSGDGVAIWNNIATGLIQSANYKVSDQTWSAPTSLSSDMSPYSPIIAVNAAGQAIAAWIVNNGTTNYIEVSIFNGTEWSSPTIASGEDSNCFFPSLGMDNAGNGMLIWVDIDIKVINGSFYDSTALAWSAVESISSTDQNPSQPCIAVTPSSGNAIAIWKNYNGISQAVYGSIYSFSSSSWSVPITISSLSTVSDDPTIVVDAQNNGIAIWRAFNGTNFTIDASTYSSTNQTWSIPVILSTGGVQENPDAFVNISAAVFTVFLLWNFSADSVNFYIQAMRGS